MDKMSKSKKSKKKKKLLVGIHLDPIGSGWMLGKKYEVTPEMEEQTIRRYFKEWLGDKFEFNFIRPGLTELLGKSLDVFVLDYGGMMPGCDGLIESTIRAVNKYVEEHPSCILLLWSQCTAEWFEAITEISILGDGVEVGMPNVLVLKGSTFGEFWDKLRFMLCGEEKNEIKKKDKKPFDIFFDKQDDRWRKPYPPRKRKGRKEK